MTQEQYIKEKEELLKKQYEENYALARKYALEQSPCNIGDIIEDHIGRILVEEIKIQFSEYTGSRLPFCIYYGIELRKSDNLPKLSKSKRSVYQFNLERIVSKKS